MGVPCSKTKQKIAEANQVRIRHLYQHEEIIFQFFSEEQHRKEMKAYRMKKQTLKVPSMTIWWLSF